MSVHLCPSVYINLFVDICVWERESERDRGIKKRVNRLTYKLRETEHTQGSYTGFKLVTLQFSALYPCYVFSFKLFIYLLNEQPCLEDVNCKLQLMWWLWQCWFTIYIIHIVRNVVLSKRKSSINSSKILIAQSMRKAGPSLLKRLWIIPRSYFICSVNMLNVKTPGVACH